MSSRVQIGYGENLEAYNPLLPLILKLKKLNRAPGTPFEEAKIAAKEAYVALKATPTLCLSGGIDSEVMALAFLAAEIPFDVTTLRFKDGLNEHEIVHAKEFCKARNLRQHFIDLDVIEFFEKERYLEYQDKYFCYGLEITVQLWFMEQIRRPFVWAGDPFRMFLNEGKPEVQAVSGYEAVIDRYVNQNKLNAVANFHFFSPEIAWSFFRESLKVKSLVHAGDHTEEHYADKLAFYNYCGFQGLQNPTRKVKSHGFELVKMYFDQKLAPRKYIDVYRNPIIRKYPVSQNAVVKIEKHDLIAREILGIAP